MSAAPERSFANSTEAIQAAYKLMTIGCDSFYTNNSAKLIKDLRTRKCSGIKSCWFSSRK